MAEMCRLSLHGFDPLVLVRTRGLERGGFPGASSRGSQQRRAELITEVPDVARGGADVLAGREPDPRSSEALGLVPAIPLLQSARDPLERLARQGRRFPAHPALVYQDHPVEVDPGRPVLAVPATRADGYKIALAIVVLAG